MVKVRKSLPKVITKEEREKIQKTKEENDRLFQVYMIEIWQWKLVDWQVTPTWTYKDWGEILDEFKGWLKWAKNTK